MEHTNETRKGNYVVRTYPDTSPESPREDSNLGKMICFHNRYDLGDKHGYMANDYNGWEELREQIEKDYNVGVILPLYLYDHSGITISTSPFNCRWDSGQVGFIFISKEKMLEEYGGKIVIQSLRDRVEGYLKGEVEIYDKYLRGDVYGYKLFKIDTCDKGYEHEEELDSCWGFYGEEECMNEGVSIMEYYLNEEIY